jgi:hypothetical protein
MLPKTQQPKRMKPKSIRFLKGFTPIELVIVVACMLIIGALVLPHYMPRQTTCRINCVNNLEQVGLAAPTFALDNNDLDADEKFPSRLLAGDRWVGKGGMQFRPGFLLVRPNTAVEWVNSARQDKGNVALADGSVQELSSRRLGDLLRTKGLATNRLEIP